MQHPLLASRAAITAIVCAFSLVSTSTLSAEWGIGAGVVSSQKPYKKMSRDTTPLPLLYFDNQYLHFFGTEAEIKLPGVTFSETQHLSFGLTGRYDGSGYDDNDADILDGMEKRKSGFWGGVKAQWKNPWMTLSADWTHDLSGNSHGQRVKLGAERSWQWGDFSLTPRAATIWQDKKYVDYYFGVHEEEARDGRPAYRGKSSFGAELGLLSIYRFNTHNSVMLDLETTRLSSAVKESPLVDRSSENRIFLGYMFRF
ncbi:MipA/OmpV family protein (plasmid) [Pantoea piersonii]|uniref:MipA/OmpV family protein n=1 Tax=Pantoea piersonii TaxID=2364647 RepID=A0AAJ5QMY7_9GAMM|nr:MipA/OmpV family protein [Pantoea piersonii]WBG92897.1 MipA/OmpV family protein [Pantoea piersonii]WBV23595.1 MipA/OmpV family protein [Pantoea piersonii]